MFWHKEDYQSNALAVSNFTRTCEAMATQIAVMTSLHIYLDGNYLSGFPVVLANARAAQEATMWSSQLADLNMPVRNLAICLVRLSARHSLECQLIRLFSSCTGSNFSALWRSGSTQHCFTRTMSCIECRCCREHEQWEKSNPTKTTKKKVKLQLLMQGTILILLLHVFKVKLVSTVSFTARMSDPWKRSPGNSKTFWEL